MGNQWGNSPDEDPEEVWGGSEAVDGSFVNLWASALVQLAEDLNGMAETSLQKKRREGRLTWFRDKNQVLRWQKQLEREQEFIESPLFVLVCDYLGMEPKFRRSDLLKLLQKARSRIEERLKLHDALDQNWLEEAT